MPVCDRSRGYRSDRPLSRNSIQVHSLAESPPQSSFASPPASWLSPTHEPTEVSALIAASPGASTCRERYPSPATFRPQAFSASRRLAPRFGFAGLFHPTSHVQGSSPSRGFSLRTAVLGLPSPLPPCRWPPPAHAPPLPEGTLPRRAGLDFEALLHAEKRSFDLVLPAPNVAPLIGLPSSGCCVSSPKRRSPVASARGLCSPSPSVSRSRPRPTFGVSQARARRRFVSASTRPARGFDLLRRSARLASKRAAISVSAAHRDGQCQSPSALSLSIRARKIASVFGENSIDRCRFLRACGEACGTSVERLCMSVNWLWEAEFWLLGSIRARAPMSTRIDECKPD